ncbi:MAG TPA: metallophosphoesterase family protein [Anaerolineaceae bacterium]|jgi:hypothetical protein
MAIIGVISDTHGLLRPEAVKALQGCERILHAGDVGSLAILSELQKIAPTTAVRGNIDSGDWANALPETAVVEMDGELIYMLHNLAELELQPAAAGMGVIIFGHSHRAVQEWRNGVLYLNPGSAGPRRFALPVTVARLIINGNRIEPELIELLLD